MNKHMIIGYVGKDPEIRRFPDGGALASFSVATSHRYKDKQSGERVEQTDWHNCVVSGPLVDSVVANYIKKGTRLFLSGRSVTRKWQDKTSGQDRYTTEIKVDELELLSSKDEGGQKQPEQQRQAPARQAAAPAAKVDDDDIPF